MDQYILGKDADLSEWDNTIKDYENERSKNRDSNPLVKRSQYSQHFAYENRF